MASRSGVLTKKIIPLKHDDDDDYWMRLNERFRNQKRFSAQVPVSPPEEKMSAKKHKKTVVTEDSEQLASDDNDPRQIKYILWEMIFHIEYRTEKSINELPDLVLQKIFSQFTNLTEMLVLGRVCKRWKSFQAAITFKMNHLTILICPTTESVNKAEIMRKFSKTLRVEDADDDDEEDDVLEKFAPTLLQYEQRLQPDTIQEIVGAMPNITSLTIVLDHCAADDATHSVIDLLLSYNISGPKSSPITNCHLYSRNILSGHQKSSVPQMQHKLFDAINTLLPGLECLTYDTDRAVYSNPEYSFEKLGCPIERQWPFVSRLREFNYYSGNDPNCSPLFDSLNRYASSSIDRIGINNADFYLLATELSRLYSSFARLEPRFYSKLTFSNSDLRINIRESRSDIPHLLRLVTDFSGLTRLRINFSEPAPAPPTALTQVLRVLAPLKRLIRLDLKLNMYSSGNEPVLQGDAGNPVDSIAPLESVKALYLYLGHQNHSNLYSPHWGRLFPSVQTFELIHSCDIWHIGFDGLAVGLHTERANKELLRMFADQLPLVNKWFVHLPHRRFWTKEQLDE